jgi:NTE family protein
MNKDKKASLVLSSGGARGVAHIGVIEAMLEEGYEITSISGSSMGAVVGGVYAAGKLTEYKEWLCNLDKIDVFKLMDFTLSTQGFVRGDKVFNEMKKFMGDLLIEDLSIPFAAVATDLHSKTEVVFDKGDLYTALRASAAIPSVMKPAIYDGRVLVDGGVLNPIPVQYLTRTKNDLLVISDVNANVPSEVVRVEYAESKFMLPLKEKWNSIFPKTESRQKNITLFDLITKSIDLMQDRISDFIIEDARPDIVVKVSRNTCGTFEFHRAPELIECGYKQFKKAINEFCPTS